MDLKPQIEKKLLGEDVWIDIGNDGEKVRIDYQTRSQEVEFRRLQKVWFAGMFNADTEHWVVFYLRSTIREVEGFTIEGKPAKLVLERGSAKELSNGEKSIDVIAMFQDADLVWSLAGEIMSRLNVSETEKKTQSSQPNSSGTANLETDGSLSSPVSESFVAGTPSPRTEEKIG